MAKTDAAMLLKAADIMKKQGHAKMKLVDKDGKVCLLGAINQALTGRPTGWPMRSSRLLHLVEDYLSRKAKKPPGSFNAISWNNEHRRRGHEVVSALRGAARSLKAL